MDDSDTQFNLRMPKTLRERIEEAAERSRRSATAEVLVRLEESFRREGIDPATGEPIGEESLAKVMADLSARLEVVRGLLEVGRDGDS
ncbi:Arc family DNA-binding protein [Billgrantia tianxiuensis]|uniref:Arc family DNA-binding protein n=1 Tax=Billgrantia tianxiuensis TaxID=2497861 RepID=A0A6I6SS55_9GAMM|nr:MULTISPECIES: Arc family DNA-binding protein [Halomonas]MCE8034631.1 Arc family DNA-binding protein [Halomonas sp. MCCC 1A11057]QHC50497.1 Arc family DNA-binding protein [Halomonas tianxiuensis]